MRDILFRGKRLDTGEWVEGAFYAFYNFKRVVTQILGDRTNTVPDAFEVDPATVGQYTGLKDKNGKRIFEGDVVEGLFLFGAAIKAFVAFQNGAFGLKWKRGAVTEFSAFTSICNVEYEVIGNIHDNPELMEVTDNA